MELVHEGVGWNIRSDLRRVARQLQFVRIGQAERSEIPARSARITTLSLFTHVYSTSYKTSCFTSYKDLKTTIGPRILAAVSVLSGLYLSNDSLSLLSSPPVAIPARRRQEVYAGPIKFRVAVISLLYTGKRPQKIMYKIMPVV